MSLTIRELAFATIDAQCAKGLAKYGRLLDDAHDLSPDAIADHLVQEQADGLQYALKLREMVVELQNTISLLRPLALRTESLESQLEALGSECESLRTENTRLRTALLPLARIAGELLGSAGDVRTSGSFTGCTLVGVTLRAGEPAPEPMPTPEPTPETPVEAVPVVSVLPAPPPANVTEALPRGCILSADAMAIMGVKRARFSNYKQMGLVTPQGKVRTGGGQWSDYYLRSEVIAAAKQMEQEGKAKAESVIVKPAKPAPKPKEVYPETSYEQHKSAAMDEVRKAMQLPAPFGLAFHATAQMWRTAPLGRLEPGWGFVLRLERTGEEWLGTVPISCRGNWTGKLAQELLDALRQSKEVKG